MAVFERHGIRSAERAYWYEAGTLNGLLHNNAPTSSYWPYKWYGDMAGNIVQTVPGSWLEGVAAYDSTRKIVNVVLGGDSGNNTVRVNGLGALGSQVRVTLVAQRHHRAVHQPERADRGLVGHLHRRRTAASACR